MICGVIVVLYVLLALSTFLPNPANFKEGLYDQKRPRWRESYEQPDPFNRIHARLQTPLSGLAWIFRAAAYSGGCCTVHAWPC